MPTTRLYLAPASAGKTAHVLDRVRDAARDLRATPRVVVPTHLQARAWRRRLAQSGGAIGVRLLTFDGLYSECLNGAGEAYTELSEPVQYRLIRSVVDDLTLDHYAPLAARPGFVQVLEGLIGELKAARIYPDVLAEAVADLGDPHGEGAELRLRDLARIYAVYQARLQAQGWADRAGLGWLAVEALEERAQQVACDWPLLVVDGFDDFTPVQVALLVVLAGRVGETIITLTGEPGGGRRPFAHDRFRRTRQKLEAALGIQSQALPEMQRRQAPALAHLEANLFRSAIDGVAFMEAAERAALSLLEAPERGAEVRAALRWLKACLVEDGMQPGQVALLARRLAPYRPFILQTATEFGLPVRLLGGLPLRTNPAVAALLDLLRLVLPRSEDDPEPALPRRPVVEAWRSPYLDWSALPSEGATEAIGIGPGDGDLLDAVARHGRVLGGLSQWTGILDHLANRPAEALPEDEERGLPEGVPTGAAAAALREKFQRFVQRLKPPPGEHSFQDFVRWLEDLIGPDPDLQPALFPQDEELTALRVVERVQDADPQIRERDLSALRSFKDVLRGLVWAEEALSFTRPVTFPRFFDELAGAVDAASYQLPVHPDREEIVVADVIQARGVPFRAVAVLGMAEGEFPAALGEDPFLRDDDRRRLKKEFGLPLEPSTESAEAEFFYETVTAPWGRLLLTRPRLADNGAPWQPSPYWEEVRRLVHVEAETLTSESVPHPAQVASWPELVESLATFPAYHGVRTWARESEPERLAAMDAAVDVLLLRTGQGSSPFDGDLSELGTAMAHEFGPEHIWSASRLETYRTCAFYFFVDRVLNLEPRVEPAEGLDARQLGNIYHQILEEIYEDRRVSDAADLAQLLAVLPEVAAAVLDAAPEREGFRPTAWWLQTRDEIAGNVRRSLEALTALPGGYVPICHEAAFGIDEHPPLVVRDADDSFRLRGYIDRVDRTPDGQLRVIDYKTAGRSAFDKKAVVDGKKLQLPLYALAARDALGLGQPVEGFYWHVRSAEPSGFQMGKFDGGPEAAMEVAVDKAWEAVRGVREGKFVPQAPGEGCPAYCPAAAFCWRYRPRFGG
ncbi:MAG TPA: PD-(D/E)XK nuclease family protein [Anaerolineae bacterium]|nr:PD-(D/E)XK nuclease family protein [Anaerolineae bacterium]